MKYSVIFLDLDDTLVDTVQNNKEALRDMYADRALGNYYRSFEEFYRIFQEINTNLWRLYSLNKISKDLLKSERFMVTMKSVKNLTLQESKELNDDFLSRVNTKKNVIPGSKSILGYLKPLYRLYILSNGFEEVQDKKLENAEIKPYFEKVILSDHIGINKPDPRLFEYALSEAGVKNDEAIMVGDNLNTDIMGAKNAGIAQIWFNPHCRPDEEGVRPDYTIQSLDELREIL
jgi:putative hydrolase of the HAD superfamily